MIPATLMVALSLVGFVVILVGSGMDNHKIPLTLLALICAGQFLCWCGLIVSYWVPFFS